MPIYEIENKRPIIGEGTWIAPSADIVGDVTIGKNCFVGYGAVVRGDFGKIIIGDETLVEENVVIHCARSVEIKDKVIIGHMVMIHDAVIERRSLIGMMSMICDGATIGDWTILAEQSLVRKNQTIPSGKIYAGSPAREVGNLTERHRNRMRSGLRSYAGLIQKYHKTFKRIA